jgi:hypothetical protein
MAENPGTIVPEQVRQDCDHDWKAIGFQERTPQVIAVVYSCEKCSSWTYREMQFIGYRLDSIEDELERRSTS